MYPVLNQGSKAENKLGYLFHPPVWIRYENAISRDSQIPGCLFSSNPHIHRFDQSRLSRIIFQFIQKYHFKP